MPKCLGDYMPDITKSRWPIHIQNSELFNRADVLNKRRDIVKTNVEFYEDLRTGKTEERIYYLLKLKDGSTRRYSTWEEVAGMIMLREL